MSNSPMCCGMPAFKNVISNRLEFWVCSECKKEVLDIEAPSEVDEYEGWPVGLTGELFPDDYVTSRK